MDFGLKLRSFLLERHGVINGYENIVDEVFGKIQMQRPILIDDGLYFISLKDYKLSTECFIDNLSINVYVGKSSNISSHFINNEKEESLTEEKKLKNCIAE